MTPESARTMLRQMQTSSAEFDRHAELLGERADNSRRQAEIAFDAGDVALAARLTAEAEADEAMVAAHLIAADIGQTIADMLRAAPNTDALGIGWAVGGHFGAGTEDGTP